MLRRKLSLVFKQPFAQYLSTVPIPKIENDLLEETPSETLKQDEILQYPDYFNVHNLFTVKDLFDAKVHYGHKISSLHRNMKPFVFGERLGHVIFDLDKTAYHLREALNFIAHIAYRDGIILFISKNPRMTLLVEKTALECKEYAVTRQWRMGIFTDSEKLFRTVVRLPDLCIILNTLEENGHEHQSIKEAAKMCIPTVGIVDSNCFPNLISYPIPGNDDSLSCFELYCNLFKQAILRGKNERQKDLEKFAKVSQKENVTDANKEPDASVSSNAVVNESEEIKAGTSVYESKEIKADTRVNESEVIKADTSVYESKEIKADTRVNESEVIKADTSVYESKEIKAHTSVYESKEIKADTSVYESKEIKADTSVNESDELKADTSVNESNEIKRDTSVNDTVKDNEIVNNEIK